MELVYTAINHDLSGYLVGSAKAAAINGKRVFYVTPNTQSFDKESYVLRQLETGVSFAITVTRFYQLGRYLMLGHNSSSSRLSDLGLYLAIYKVLQSFESGELEVYEAVKSDLDFIQKVQDLYQEMQTAQLTVDHLRSLDNSQKAKDLMAIMSRLDQMLADGSHTYMSSNQELIMALRSGQHLANLSNTVFVIEGFSHFSSEEEELLSLLDRYAHEVIVGVYASKKAYQSPFWEGSVYEVGCRMLARLASYYQTKPRYIEAPDLFQTAQNELFMRVESHYDYSETDTLSIPKIAKHITIRQTTTQSQEIESVAKAIRHHLYEGRRYKDIQVLVGDMESYADQIKPLFDKYEIPYYIAHPQSMKEHPLMAVVDSLWRISHYQYQTDDILQLFKTGLIGRLTQEELDDFERYVRYLELKGKRAFVRVATAIYPGETQESLDSFNQIKGRLLGPVIALLGTSKARGAVLLEAFIEFLEEVGLPQQLQEATKTMTTDDIQAQGEVWKVFCEVLEQLHMLLADEVLTMPALLSLIRQGMRQVTYKTIPASVDVVEIKSYGQAQVASKPLVYAIGLTKDSMTTSIPTDGLLTDQEKAKINQEALDNCQFVIASESAKQRDLFAALTLFATATERLIMSYPQLSNHEKAEPARYLEVLATFGVPQETVDEEKMLMPEAIGNYKALLSQVIRHHRLEILESGTEEADLWAVARRYLKKRLDKTGLHFFEMPSHPQSHPISQEALAIRYPLDEPIPLSASSVTTFYKHQYQFYLEKVLGLQTRPSIHPTPQVNGQFFHRVFDRVMQDHTERSFDAKLEWAISQTRQEALFHHVYQEDAKSRYVLSRLEAIIRDTSQPLVLAKSQTLATETALSYLIKDKVEVTGMIDRIDVWPDKSRGVVDYKSSQIDFDWRKFYHGLQPQLITYLTGLLADEAMRPEDIFGAVYLAVKDHRQPLSTPSNNRTEYLKDQQYNGILLSDHLTYRDSQYKDGKLETITTDELVAMMRYQESLYLHAEAVIRSGQFAINPYTEDGRSIPSDVEQYKAITGFEANYHMSQARRMDKGPTYHKHKRDYFLELIRSGKEDDQDETALFNGQ